MIYIVEATIWITDAVWIVSEEALAIITKRGLREQDVCVGIREIVIDTPSTADHCYPIAVPVISKTDARRNIVTIRLQCSVGTILESFEPGEIKRQIMQSREQCIARLIDVKAGNKIVPYSCVDCQFIVHIPVILEINPVLLIGAGVPEMTGELCDLSNRRIRVIGQMEKLRIRNTG